MLSAKDSGMNTLRIWGGGMYFNFKEVIYLFEFILFIYFIFFLFLFLNIFFSFLVFCFTLFYFILFYFDFI